jgi:hypothetical protein
VDQLSENQPRRCIVCGRRELDATELQTCVHCIGRTRSALAHIVDLQPVATKEASRLSHWPPEHWQQWRMETLTPWKLKPGRGKDWD